MALSSARSSATRSCMEDSLHSSNTILMCDHIGLIPKNYQLVYSEVVRAPNVLSCCQGNNLHIELQEAVERRTQPHQYEQDSSGVYPNLQFPGAHTNDHLTWTLHVMGATWAQKQQSGKLEPLVLILY